MKAVEWYAVILITLSGKFLQSPLIMRREMGRLRGWMIGAIIGVLWGIIGVTQYSPMWIESVDCFFFVPLYLLSILFYLPFSPYIQFRDISFILIPLSGMIYGILIWVGIGYLWRRILPDKENWKKGIIIGSGIGVIAALVTVILPPLGFIFFGPLMYFSSAFIRGIFGGSSLFSNLPLLLLLAISLSTLVGGAIGYILDMRKNISQKTGDTKRRDLVIHVTIAAICIIAVGALLLASGLIQPTKIFPPHYSTSFGRMTVLATFPESPRTMTIYKVDNDNGSGKTPLTTVEIIPAPEAFEQLKNGDFQGPRFKCFCDFILENVSAGYYQTQTGKNVTYLEPAWIFRGTLSDGMPWEYYVYARKDYGYLQERVYTPDQLE